MAVYDSYQQIMISTTQSNPKLLLLQFFFLTPASDVSNCWLSFPRRSRNNNNNNIWNEKSTILKKKRNNLSWSDLELYEERAKIMNLTLRVCLVWVTGVFLLLFSWLKSEPRCWHVCFVVVVLMIQFLLYFSAMKCRIFTFSRPCLQFGILHSFHAFKITDKTPVIKSAAV